MSEDPKVSPEDEAAAATPTAEQPPAEGRSASGASSAASSEGDAAPEKKPRVRRARKAPAAKAEAAVETVEEKPSEEKPSAAPEPARVGPTGRRPVVRAHAKYVRTSARKARLVCDHIRGKSVPEARAILEFAPRAVARDWAKLLASAVANAENNHELLADDLTIKEVYADEGPTLKRYRPRAMGRATRIRKRTSHLTIALTPKETS
jgi:ribosomal protein L22